MPFNRLVIQSVVTRIASVVVIIDRPGRSFALPQNYE